MTEFRAQPRDDFIHTLQCFLRPQSGHRFLTHRVVQHQQTAHFPEGAFVLNPAYGGIVVEHTLDISGIQQIDAYLAISPVISSNCFAQRAWL